MPDDTIDTLPYRPCVGVLLFNREGDVFVGQRVDQEIDAWQMPQGGIHKGEEPETAALRELEEETGARSVTVLAESREWHAYDLPKDLVKKVWKGKYRGQTQKWFAMAFTGDESEIDPTAVDHPEFTKWCWASLDELPRIAVPFKRDVYVAVAAEFAEVAARLQGTKK